MDDDQIHQVLARLGPIGYEDIPHEGEWQRPPYKNDTAGRAIVLVDGDFQFVVVDRFSGAVRSVCEDDETLMASSLDQLVQIATLWGAIDRDAIGPEDDDEFDRVARNFESQLKRIDPAAARPSEFWCLYAEELSNGG
ncbi:SUKH-4 family immunity protein [Paenarthrobacter sp. Z7-10]|uniref:SUKH-4 family immunity protein n=1 Tax=Paenarthrobacter sp. Z7-10 TaxID=2787635 RepID=UPI0022A9C7F1|nr:SUKH-4 family immunity protein [Paenarthrobacter sp. Z7-10]MCZ2404523.1 SUKH-4 family immunity protein [Paenarthrobacter sp. Z7-10]